MSEEKPAPAPADLEAAIVQLVKASGRSTGKTDQELRVATERFLNQVAPKTAQK